MFDTTLLNYLTLPNPELNCSNSLMGTNTLNARWDPITGLEDWPDFNYDSLLHSYGHILHTRVTSLPAISPPLTELEKEIFTETTFETVLIRDIMPQVSAALRVAWPLLYYNNGDDIADISKGAKARRGTAGGDDQYHADWAGIRRSMTTDFGYKNLCPGETKLASKWGTSKEGRGRRDYLSPFNQIQTYCGRQWGTRHGYIITPEELVVVRVSREAIGAGLAASRPFRSSTQHRDQPSHSRTFSAETVSSSLQAMSLTGSSFSDDANPDVEYGKLQFKSIPWKAAGMATITVKLALWWLHMETAKDLSVQEYPPPTIGTQIPVQNIQGEATASAPEGSSSAAAGSKQKGKASGRRP